MAVFADVVRRNRLIRSVSSIYGAAPQFVKACLLLLYGFKCYSSVNWKAPGRFDLALFASYPNERAAVAYLRRHVRDLRVGDLTITRANCFRLAAVQAALGFWFSAGRLYRIARRLARRYPFMPACRTFSTVAYYARFLRLLRQQDAKAFCIANHYSPECLGLAAAAHRLGHKVVFTNHANATWRNGYAPALHCDLIAVTSRAVLDAYVEGRRDDFEAVLIPQASPQGPMRKPGYPETNLTVGVFLTALTKMKRLEDLVQQLEADPRVAKIVIRPHPVKVVNEDLSDLTARGSHVIDSGDMALFDNAALCDVAICGNSTVSVELLRGGLPVLYDHSLDGLSHDYNGYLEQGLVMALPPRLDAAALQSLWAFYSAPSWAEVMGYFDAGYGQDEALMLQRLNEVLYKVLRSAPATAAIPRGEGIPTELSYPAALS